MLRREALASRNPYVTSLTRVMDAAAQAGAVGAVGVLRDYPESTAYHNEYYRRTLLTLPGVWVTRATGEALRRTLADHGRLSYLRTLRVEPARLGQEAGLVGAAALFDDAYWSTS